MSIESENTFVLIAGNTCSGKSTLTNSLADSTGYPVVYLDDVLFSGSKGSVNGRGSSKEQFFSDAEETIQEAQNKSEGIIVDGTYLSLAALTWNRASHIAFLDPNFATITYRILKRTSRGKSVQNGNLGYQISDIALPGKDNVISKAWRFQQEKRPKIIEQLDRQRSRGATILHAARISANDFELDDNISRP